MLSNLFVEALRLCASLGMVGLGHITFDGTKRKGKCLGRQDTGTKEGLERDLSGSRSRCGR